MSFEESNFNKKIQLVNESLISTIKKFQNNPANFFFEEDIRALMFVELYNNFQDKVSVPLVEDSWFKYYKENEIEINPVRSEYGNDKEYKSLYGISKLDIAILSNQTIDNKGRHNYQRFCDVIIEIKYSTENFDSKRAGFIYDFTKIKEANKVKNQLGIAICFDLHSILEKNEQSFIETYMKYGIKFQSINVNTINLSLFSYYAIYVAPNKVYIYGEKE